MLAVSAHADGKGPCPWELAEALLCQRYQVLPDAGGLAQQDLATLSRHATLLDIYQTCRRFAQGGLKALSSSERDLNMKIAQLEWEQKHGPT